MMPDSALSSPFSPSSEVTDSSHIIIAPNNETSPMKSKAIDQKYKLSLSGNAAKGTIFQNLAYVGSVSIDSPKDRIAIIGCIKLFNYNKQVDSRIPNANELVNKVEHIPEANQPLLVNMVVPESCLHSVMIYEQGTGNEIAKFKISRIMFCARGEEGSPEESFFAFTCSHGKADTPLDAIFKCHIFQCLAGSFTTTGVILVAFSKAFRRPDERHLKFVYPPTTPFNHRPNASQPQLVNAKDGIQNGAPQEIYTRVIGVSLEIKEEINKGHYSICPVDSNTRMFKLRHNLEKCFTISVHSFTPSATSPTTATPGSETGFEEDDYSQNENQQPRQQTLPQVLTRGLVVERCFGIHITPGSDFNQNKLHLLDIVSMNHPNNNESVYNITVLWDPKEYNMEEFIIHSPNREVSILVFTLGLDLIFTGVQEPIRLLLNVRSRMYPETEKFWYYLSKQKALRETYYVELQRVISSGDIHVSTVKSHSQITKLMSNTDAALLFPEPPAENNSYNFSNLNTFLSVNGTSLLSALPTSLLKPSLLVPKLLNRVNSTTAYAYTSTTPDEENYDFLDGGPDGNSDNDEPLLSGTGQVRKDCETSELETWAEILSEWRSNMDKRPKRIPLLCQKGIPDALRGEVWQLLAKTHEDEDKLELYKDLITKETDYEKIIVSDIYRTFPAHEYFKRKFKRHRQKYVPPQPTKPTNAQVITPPTCGDSANHNNDSIKPEEKDVALLIPPCTENGVERLSLSSDLSSTVESYVASNDISPPNQNLPIIDGTASMLLISPNKITETFHPSSESPTNPPPSISIATTDEGIRDNLISQIVNGNQPNEVTQFLNVKADEMNVKTDQNLNVKTDQNLNVKTDENLNVKADENLNVKADQTSCAKADENGIREDEFSDDDNELGLTNVSDSNQLSPAVKNENSLGSSGQECLYRLIKAYSVYDIEIGYCQGLSFLAASLLLHMPEEQAFCLLAKIMYDYDLRNLFKQGFQELQLKFYQLERLIQENLPALYTHFTEIGIEVHMFASQWFLTIFTAKFPLNIVFNILDVFLCNGMNTIYAVSLSLLKLSERDLLHLDFEDVLKYFRVNLPKKFRNEKAAQKMMVIARLIKVSNKKLKKYEKDYNDIKEREEFEKDPMEILKRDNIKLKEGNMRLERENDLLAQELVSSKIRLRNDLDATEDTAESLSLELEQTSKTVRDLEEENKRLVQEIHQIKEMCRREVQRFEDKLQESLKITQVNTASQID